MAIEVAPKKEERPLWQTILFYLSFVLLVLSLLVFLFLKVYYLPQLSKDIKEKITQINQENDAKDGTAEDAKTIGRIVEDVKVAKTEIDNFRDVYNNDRKASNFFPLFEGIVHPMVYFDSFDLTLGEDVKASLSGKTNSYESLIQQIEILQHQTFISSFEVSNIVKGDGGAGVSFNLLLNLTSPIFKRSNI